MSENKHNFNRNNKAEVKFANNLGINLIFYGEDGEVEYGGSSETSQDFIYNINYMKKVYLEGGYSKRLEAAESKDLNGVDLFKFPEKVNSSLEITHWSYFENWDPYRNYLKLFFR